MTTAQKGIAAGYTADYLSVALKTLDFLHEDKFNAAWQKAHDNALNGYAKVPDIRWRVHIALWAARHGMNLEGDFVECGVYTGFLSLTIAHYLDFQTVDKKFYLYDVWDEIPLERVNDDEKSMVERYNKDVYGAKNVYDATVAAFAPFPNCKLVRGYLPDTLADGPEKIAYLSIDLNNTQAEENSIAVLWPRLVKGAIVVIDDYGWQGHEKQRQMWDAFAAAKGTAIGNLPTGQGLLIKI